MLRKIVLLALMLAVLAACGNVEDESSTPDAEFAPGEEELLQVRLPMGFVPDPQYAPYYMADARGYYADAGMEISFDYSFETDGIALVGAGELPFAIVSGDQVVLARAQDLPVVYVMEWFQQYPIAVVSLAEAGIETPADLTGRSIGLPGFFGATYVGYAGLLRANGIDQAAVNASEIGFTQVETLLTGQVDAVAGYINNEPVQLRAQGQEINVLAVADYIDLVANGIITNETFLAENPDLVQAFVDATLRGLADTLADPDAAYEISKEYVEGLDDSRRPVLEASLPLWDAEVPGLTERAAWENTEAVLLETGFLDAPLEDLEAAYTNRFIDGAGE